MRNQDMSYFQLLEKSIANMFRDPAMITGIISGGCLSILWLILVGIGIILGEKGNSDFPWLAVSIILTTATFLLTGMFASGQTGRVSTGTLAGLVAGLTGWTLLWIFHEWISSMGESQVNRVGFLLWDLLMLSIGAGIGTLGGLMVIWAKSRQI